MNDNIQKQGQKNLIDILDMEQLLKDRQSLIKWQKETKKLLNINKYDTKEKLLKKYKIQHSDLCKEELSLRLKMLNEVLKYLL